LKGLDDYHLNWLGFEGEDMEATIDLGSVQSVKKVGTDFLQDINAWIFLPTTVEFSVSEDGQRFVPVAALPNTVSQERKGVWSVPFIAQFEPTQTRYVRVKAHSLKKCPDWHKGAGGLCWIFADEIVVE
jgi:hexosaminidase